MKFRGRALSYGCLDGVALKVYEKATRKLGKPGLGSDEFDIDRGVTAHAAYLGETLCGVPVGSESRGWFLNQYVRQADALSVSCRRCRRTLERLEAEVCS